MDIVGELMKDIEIRERDLFLALVEPHTATETGQTIVEYPLKCSDDVE